MTDGFSSVVCNTDMTSCPLIRARPNSTFARQIDFDRECRNGEEVHCGDGFPMIVQKSEPTLGRPRVSQGAAHPTRYGSLDRKSTRLNSSHRCISYAVFCLKKKKKNTR